MSDLPRSTPVAQGVDPAAVLAFVDAVDADPAVELHSLMVLRHGCVVAEGWWAPHTSERTRLLYSLSKSFTSTALAFAMSEGLVRPRRHSRLPLPGVRRRDHRPAQPVDHPARTWRRMAGGHTHDMWQEALARDPEEPVRGFLLLPPDERTGHASSPTANRAPTPSQPSSSAEPGCG